MKIARIGAVELLILGIGLAAQDTSVISGRNYEVFTGQIDLPPQLRTRHNTTSGDLIGPLFLYHPESEFSAVCLPVNSRLAANSLANSFGVLSPSAL